MAKQERPPRSLRGDSGPQYSRDWASADAVLSQRDYALDSESWEEEQEPQLEAQEMEIL